MDDFSPDSGLSAPELLTPQEAARRLGICTRTLRGHVKAGTISYVAVGHGTQRQHRMFAPADLENFCDRQRRRDVPPVATEYVRLPKGFAPRIVDFTALRASRQKDKGKTAGGTKSRRVDGKRLAVPCFRTPKPS